jgi:hypothetical protein
MNMPRELRDYGVYRLPSGEVVFAVKVENDRYLLYRQETGTDSMPYAEVTSDGNVIPLLLTGSGCNSEDLIDMARDYVQR